MADMRPFGLLAGTDPFRELRRLQDEMSRLVGVFAPAAELAAAAGTSARGAGAALVVRDRRGFGAVAACPRIFLAGPPCDS
jgi:hypothetical protein